jgi:deoxyribodipyrimidine photo-lyase
VIASDRIDQWQLLPRKPDWAGGLVAAWTPGEAAARRRLADFVDGALRDYATGRERPDRDGSSRLSPHLRWGEISPRQIWHAVEARVARAPCPGAETFLSEIGWREFSYNLLFYVPDLRAAPLRPAFSRFPWRPDPAALKAWQQGRTGYPIVDAGMRQLWTTGWMHNRVRMIAASFLVKHLLQPWQDGEAWFFDTLVDADAAANGGNWQWVAGCGTDSSPYFRIFNPILQGRKFDPDGAYVREWVPELRARATDRLHEPLAPDEYARFPYYPPPLVDHAEARQRALAAFEEIRGNSEP